MDAGHRHMGVRVAGSDKDRGIPEVTSIMIRVDPIADQPPGKGRDTAITGSIAGHVFEGETGAL